MTDLRVAYPAPGVAGVSFSVDAGEVVALVGTSGGGKSSVASALLRLLPPWATVAGRVEVGGIDVLRAAEVDLRRIRGGRIGAVFQNAGGSLDPTMPVGPQVAEAARLHLGLHARAAMDQAVRTLAEVGLPDAPRRARLYPGALSGGMRQRVALAVALAARPALLVVDEPVSALDAEGKVRVCDLFARRRAEGGALLLITHDLSLVARLADRVLVLYAGRIVERGPADAVLGRPAHPHTRGLRHATAGAGRALLGGAPAQGCAFAPHCPHVMRGCLREAPPALAVPGAPGHLAACWLWHADAPPERRGSGHPWRRAPRRAERPAATAPALTVRALERRFGTLRAVDGVSFTLRPGESLGLVGESGCGKSTLARVVVGLLRPSAGEVRWGGRRIHDLPSRERRALLQIVFQDPYDACDPRLTVGATVGEGLPPRERGRLVGPLLEAVALPASAAAARPAALSGGQRQRVAIARALAVSPRLLVADEPLSALDTATQAQIVALLARLGHERGLGLLLLAHDLALVRRACARVAVMYAGRFVEAGAAAAVLRRPLHPYTRALAAAHDGTPPTPGPTPPGDPRRHSAGCPYAPRCPLAVSRCWAEAPSLRRVAPGRRVACHLVTAAHG